MFVIAPPDVSPRPPLAAVGEVSAVIAGRRHRVFRTELGRAITDLGLGSGVVSTLGAVARGGRVIAPAGAQPAQPGGDGPVYDDGVLRITRIPGAGPGVGADPGRGGGYALAGEIDESTVGGLSGKLAEIAAGLDEVHLDLAALDYSDLAGLRVIVQLAAEGRRHVVLHHVPPHLRAILGIVGWDTAPGVELAS
jgi:ABC-type transporter Mla MlaB component